MRSPKAFLGLGANLGAPEAQLRRAVRDLEERGVELQRLSSFYRTEPVDAPPEPWFVNAAAAVEFGGSPHELLRICLSLEAREGRTRPFEHAPRRLDLDLLLFGDAIVRDPELTLPHPRLHERRFVLEPMVEIAPETIHPVLGKSMRELLEACPDRSVVSLR